MIPFVLVFQQVYQDDASKYTKEELEAKADKNVFMMNTERVIDIFFVVEIALNFVKRTRANKDIQAIAFNYMTSLFLFDLVGTLPELIFFDQSIHTYWLKCFRFVHFFRFTIPVEMVMSQLLAKYSKKRQNDLTSFGTLIVNVIYISHISACIWINLGYQSECLPAEDGTPAPGAEEGSDCVVSWIYDNGFAGSPIHSIYIFAFYWIFEVITTVGYGDYSGKTSSEYVFSIILEFLGLTFFSFLMGSINDIFDTADNFDDLIEEKLDQLDMWIKKIEKSNKPFHIQPILYNDIRKYVEQAFMYDFNLVIEEFSFYQ